MPKARIGFIGLGVMGRPMAGHIAAAGYPLTVYDIAPEPTRKLRKAHPDVVVAKSARVVAAASDIVFTMLPSGREVRDTVFGSDGLLDGLAAGGLLIDTSSSEPWYTKEIEVGLAGVGVAVVDAPVSGAESGAIAAELVFMVGGEPEAVRRARPLLKVLGKKVFHLGGVGAGHVMKSINNLITAVTFLATAEGLVIGRSYGLDVAVMNDVLNLSTGMSWISRNHIPQRILTRKYDDPFKFDLMVKDINIALQVAGDRKLDVPLADRTRQLWQQMQAKLPRGRSVSELVRALEMQNGVELVPKARARRS
jgi:3-hydroxyisobutyrate dehydrogenase